MNYLPDFLKQAVFSRPKNPIEGPQYGGSDEALAVAGLQEYTPEWWEARQVVLGFLACRRNERPHPWVQGLAAGRPDLDGYVDVTWLTQVTRGSKRHPITNTAFRVKGGKARALRSGENPGELLALVDWRPVQRGRADEPDVVWTVRAPDAPIMLVEAVAP